MRRQREDDLYFMLNPGLGIIKIGIAADVEARRSQLECACGVPLTVLRVVEGGASYEKRLHLAFGPSRLLGEWFTPTVELLALIDGNEPLNAFLQRKAADIQAWEREIARRSAERKEQQQAAAKAEREEAERLAAEEKRIRAEKKAKREAALARAAEKRAEMDNLERQRIERERAEWAAKHPDLAARVFDGNATATASGRRLAIQRLRNAAFTGVEPAVIRSHTESN